MGKYVFIILAFLFACQDQNEKFFDQNISYRSPVVNANGILTFSSAGDFQNYYNYLDSIANNSEDPDSMLQVIENSKSLVSYRAINYFDSVSLTELNNYYASEYIPDIIMQSIFNEYAEYKIGTDYYTYLGPNRFYKIKNNDFNTLLNFRGVARGDHRPDVSFYNDNVEIISGGGIDIIIGSDVSKPINPRTSDVELIRDLRPDTECGYAFNRIFTGELVLLTSNGWEPITGYWTITWGDGTSNTYDNVSSISAPHSYGSYYEAANIGIHINYNHPDRGAETFTDDIEFIINRDCRYQEYSEVDDSYAGSRLLRSKIWYCDSGFDNAIHAYTHCWKLDGSTYTREKGELDVSVAITWYSTILYCGIEVDKESESDDCNNCKRIQAMKVYHNDGTWAPSDPPTSTHGLSDGGENISDEQILNPCD